MYITLSSAYTIRNEEKASFLIRVDKIINLRRSDFGAFCIPPFIGYILTHIGDFEYSESLEVISNELSISSQAIDKFVQQLVNNPENKEFKINDTQSIVLPAFLLIRTTEKQNRKFFQDTRFNGLADYAIVRPSVPISANLMVTTKCNTNCIYCYANRKLQPLLPTEKIIALIKELYDQGTVNVTLTGGDIFAHPDWRIILQKMRFYGYKPFLSTKTPLTFDEIQILRELGYDEIQFSLDSSNSQILKKLIGVAPQYIEKVSSFLKDCSLLGLDVLIRSVLTKLNASPCEILSLYEFLEKFKCVKEWIMTPAFFSSYKEKEYKSLEVQNEDLIDVYRFSNQDNLAFRIGLNKITDRGYVLKKFENVDEYVCNNQICMANTTCISILANGDCSVCEMLYDNPEYLLGNVLKSSIKDIWNSNKALRLYSMSQNDFPTNSSCKNCKVFNKCRNEYGKRVCYLDIAKSGHSKFFPDPRCPLSENYSFIL